MTTAPLPSYPVRVDARLDRHLSRWLWLVKWVLLVPHYVVLAFLWLGFAVLSVVAFFGILLTGRYPRGIFSYNLGVLRWTWRVHYYAYGALGTDRYPPFSLREEPDFPAHLEIPYPECLSRGLVLVKWWLLALPHYLIVGILLGGLAWAGDRTSQGLWPTSAGLIGLLVLIAAVALAVTGTYPQSLYDLVLGLDRWVLRVAAYAALMTDAYPPFRLDSGGDDPGGRLAVTAPAPAVDPGPTVPPAPVAGAAPAAPSTRRQGWSGGRVTSVIAGSLLALLSLGLLGGGGVVLWADRTQRVDGYLTSSTELFTTSGYALTTDALDLSGSGSSVPRSLLGTVRVRVHAVDPSQAVFVGIAPADAVASYLRGVASTTVSRFGGSGATGPRESTVAGGAPVGTPAQQAIWVAKASGTGDQLLTWRPSSGTWRVVVMPVEPVAGLSVMADIGARVPGLGWVGLGLLVAGVLVLVAAVPLIAVPVHRAGRTG